MSNLIFGKWDTKVVINDTGLSSYIHTEAKLSLFTQGRHSKKIFGRANTNIVERLINNMMRSGTGGKLAGKVIRDRGGTGKKTKMYRIAKDAFDIINKKTGANPLEVFVRALENSAPGRKLLE